MISFTANSAATWSSIAGFVVVVLGIGAYWLGVIRPLKATVSWRATTHAQLGSAVFVEATLKSRTRNAMTVFDADLVEDPGWPRRLRARVHQPDLKPFDTSSVPNGGSVIDGHGDMEIKAALKGTQLPFRKTRLWIRAGKRTFYFKLQSDR